MKVLVDPAVAKDKTLRQNISHKRNEALARCNEMKEKLGQGQRYISMLGSFLIEVLVQM